MDLPQYDPRKIKVRRGDNPEDLQALRDDPSWRTLRNLIENAVVNTGPNGTGTQRDFNLDQEQNRRAREFELRRLREWQERGGPAPRLDPYGHRTAWAHQPRSSEPD